MLKRLTVYLQQLYQRKVARKNPQLLIRQSIYWGVILLSSSGIGLTIHQAQSVPATIQAAIDQLLQQRPEYLGLMVVDGRDVFAHGKIEADDEIDLVLEQIRSMPLVRSVTNLLEIEPKPAPHLLLSGSSDSLQVSGELPGASLEQVISAIENSFPDSRILDQVRIDDRLGTPLWLDGLAQGLPNLNQLNDFELHAWRKHLQLAGTADDAVLARRVGYSLPAGMRSQISMDNRVALRRTSNQAQIELIADWSGTHLDGSLANTDDIKRLTDAAQQAFGEHSIEINLTQANGIQAAWLADLIELMPRLGAIRSLRLQNDDKHLSMWGSVDNPNQLGALIHHRQQLQHPEHFIINIDVAPALQPAVLTLFADQTHVYLGGTLPTLAAKNQIESSIGSLMARDHIISEIKVQPGIASSDWMQVWQRLVLALPEHSVGMSVNDRQLLITGLTQQQQQIEQIDDSITQLLPDIQLINWVKIH